MNDNKEIRRKRLRFTIQLVASMAALGAILCAWLYTESIGPTLYLATVSLTMTTLKELI